MNGYRPQGYRNRLIIPRLSQAPGGTAWTGGSACPTLQSRVLWKRADCGGGNHRSDGAWRLAQRGIRVEIFDAGNAGCEASWAGAGMLAPGAEIDGPSEIAESALRSLRQFPDFVRELEEETKRSIDYRPCGALELAVTDEEAEALTRRAALQAEMGIHSEACSHNGLPARFYPQDAVVDPREVTAALLAACRRRGVWIRRRRAGGAGIFERPRGSINGRVSGRRLRDRGRGVELGSFSAASRDFSGARGI